MTVRILVGDVRERLAELPDNSVQCVVTSPPYFGLRSYNTPPQVWGGDADCNHEWVERRYYVEGGGGAKKSGEAFSEPGEANAQRIKDARWRDDGTCQKCGAWLGHLGLEPTLALFLDHLVDVFREVRRVLRPDGVCFINIGDSYASTGGGAAGGYDGGILASRPNHAGTRLRNRITTQSGLKPKDLMMVPARLAIALCDDGWYLRSDIIWHKKAPMPESVTDRPTLAHEHIFLLTKQPKYFYDAAAVAEESVSDHGSGNGYARPEQISRGGRGQDEPWQLQATRNLRNVWTLSPEPFPSAHFAVYPTELPRRCIKAGTSEKGACSACGAPWRRVVERPVSTWEARKEAGHPARYGEFGHQGKGNGWGGRLQPEPTSQTTGWEPSCACDADVVPCRVLDPFGGAGTTGLVADELGRDCTLIELNPEYVEMARSRIYGAAPMFAAVEVA